jgi:formylglycine-generating enzyme required for sulfatase activity
VHRDVKPANILLDQEQRAHLADFGLALREEEFGSPQQMAGTPVYMSPEQASGEGHLIDGRSDVFSLGVVLYELLCGQPPFDGQSLLSLFEQITTTDVRRLQPIADEVPDELERICLKALARRLSDRYTTALAFAEDLTCFLESSPQPSTATRGNLSVGAVSSVRIVPKGLRVFDAHDSHFFLGLLPGPRDRDGLPETLRFWKHRLEARGPDEAFRIGLLYGPSGCGKSSLVRAGLLPRLAEHVSSIYVEATGCETETRLLRALYRRFPGLGPAMGLRDAVATVRRGDLLPPGHKLLIVLDQFEQWLHARAANPESELIAALRHCDGTRVQGLILVRDDFWMATTQFLDQLETRLVVGDNAAPVDLFPIPHAEQVLAAFGRAYAALPDDPRSMTFEQVEFIHRAVADISEAGKVSCIRLALFADMMKSKRWTPSSLKSMGGATGVGVAFLEETISAPAALPHHRRHQEAARSVLKALLPETGSNIKGSMRSQAELLQISGYARHPRDFAELIQVLDCDVRLITPTHPQGEVEGADVVPAQGVVDQQDVPAACVEGPSTHNALPSQSPSLRSSTAATAAAAGYYQLTHDYLVPALRDWLTRQQRETRAGRAELCLAERAAIWHGKPENRHLPSIGEAASIWLLTRRHHWTEPQRSMMRQAGLFFGLRTLLAATLLVAVITGGITICNRVVDRQNETRARGLVDALLTAEIAQVPELILDLAPYRQWADTRLQQAMRNSPDSSAEHLHASLALLPADPQQVHYLQDRLVHATAEQLPVIRDALAPYHRDLSRSLWEVLDDSAAPADILLPVASALARYESREDRWRLIAGRVAESLVAANPVHLSAWMESLRPAREFLLPRLAFVFRDPARERTELQRNVAANILADYAADQPELLADLILSADPSQFAVLFPVLERHGVQAEKLLERELDRQLAPEWEDPPLNPQWSSPDPAVVQQIEAADGLMHSRFAICQTMRFDGFLHVAELLRVSGYRPVRVRPFSDQVASAGKPGQHDSDERTGGDEARNRIGAVWRRDGREWRIHHGLDAAEMRTRERATHEEGFVPVDAAGYVTTDNGRAVERYVSVWVRRDMPDEDAQLYVGLTSDEHLKTYQTLQQEGFDRQLTVQAFRAATGQVLYCGVKSRGHSAESMTWDIDKSEFDRREHLDKVLQDVCVYPAAADVSSQERSASDPDDLYYAAVWQVSSKYSARHLWAGSPREHRDGMRQLAAEGYRPAALSLCGRREATSPESVSVWHLPVVPEDAKETLGQRQANAAVTLWRLGRQQRVRPFLVPQPDPRVRSWFIHRAGPLGLDKKALVNRVDEIMSAQHASAVPSSPKPSVSDNRGRQIDTETAASESAELVTLLLTLGEYPDLAEMERDRLVARVLDRFRDDPDPGVHGSCEWLLRKWGKAALIEEINQAFATGRAEGQRRWYLTKQRQTMVILPGPSEFLMGSPGTERNRMADELLHQRRIDRSFAIAAKETTVAELEQFLRENPSHYRANPKQYSPDERAPCLGVSWYGAAAYCRWLSEQEGISADQMCFPAISGIKDGLQLPEDYLLRTGYRLPTEAEWEYACRAGTVTSRYYGDADSLLQHYGWFIETAEDRSWPVGTRKPNDFGLFDTLGNVVEWCQESCWSYPPGIKGKPMEDVEDARAVTETLRRPMRGGAFNMGAEDARAAYRLINLPNNRLNCGGLRIARTCP